MKINCGIIGLPNVGKSTLFTTLTNIPVKIANFPFCTIQPNIAIVQIPDTRVHQLNNIVRAHKIMYGTMEFIDLAGLIKGASRGEGLGNQILNHIRTAKILCHVVRCFDNDSILHIKNNIDPIRDVNIIDTELILFDILECEKNIASLKKVRKINDKIINNWQLFILKKCLHILYKGIPLRKVKFSKAELQSIQKFNFLTFKPIIYIANVNSQQITKNVHFQKLNIFGCHENSPVIPFYIENDMQCSLQLQDKILSNITRNIFFLLRLNTFFTINLNMIRAWVNIIGTTALNTARYIHSDFKKGFIRVQVIKFNDFIMNKGELGSKKAGKIFIEGKDYCVEDGDILKFLFCI